MLRDYQKDIIRRIYSAYRDGHRSVCAVLPCGGGKSIILAHIIRQATEKGRRVLFLVHRRELCEQIAQTFSGYGVYMPLCSIGMVQTVSRQLPRIQKPDLIVTDEGHHALARTYKKIYDYFSDVPRLYVTATPERLDGSGLSDVCDILVEGVDAQWLISNNYLSPYDYYAPGVSLPKFHIKRGEYDNKEINNFFRENQNIIYGDAIRHYRKIADGKKAICYLPSIEASQSIARAFTDSGIAAAHIDGDTPKGERERIISDFRSGSIRILCNVDIISEGFDVPDCECCILLRPTKSLTLYIQQSMRCMRYREGKRAAIIDHVNNIAEHGFPDKKREWLLEGHKRKKTDGEAPVKTCKNCFACVPAGTKECPHCGYIFESESSGKRVLSDYELKLINDNIKTRVKTYISPSDCTSVRELQEYARLHGYKPGWVYYQQKNRGWLSNDKGRNKAPKRYPCRPV